MDKISYISHTAVTFEKRFEHCASIKRHKSTVQGIGAAGQEITRDVTVTGRSVNKFELCILEALLIKENIPVINAQDNDFNRTLKIFC